MIEQEIKTEIRKQKGYCRDIYCTHESEPTCPLHLYCSEKNIVFSCPNKKYRKLRLRKLDELDGFPHQSKSEKIKELQTELANLNTDFVNMAQSCMEAEKQVSELKEYIKTLENKNLALLDKIIKQVIMHGTIP